MIAGGDEDYGQNYHHLREALSSKFSALPLFLSARPCEPSRLHLEPSDVSSSGLGNLHPIVGATGTRQKLGNIERTWQ